MEQISIDNKMETRAGKLGDRGFQRDETRRKEAGVQVHMDTTVYATPYIIVTFWCILSIHPFNMCKEFLKMFSNGQKLPPD